jgi:hypothetical protein
MQTIRLLRYIAIAFLTAGLSILLSVSAHAQPPVTAAPPALIAQQLPPPQLSIPQIFRVNDVWRAVYERIPDLPLANGYVSSVTRDAAEDNTFVDRLIRYHVYVKNRPPIYRLDWKLTMADFFGVNEWVKPELYPGANTLTENPVDEDTAIVQSLTRTQREELITTIIEIFYPSYEQDEAASYMPVFESEAQPSTTTNQAPVILAPQPGDALLLAP